MISSNLRLKLIDKNILLLVIISLSACMAQHEHMDSSSIFGFTVKDKTLEKSETEAILQTLLPETLWEQHGFKLSGTVKSKSYLVDYGKLGKIISIEKTLSGRDNMISVHIERPVSIKLRHKIMIGIDKVKWNVVKKETTYPDNNPFYRVYLLQHTSGRLFQGIIFMEGVWVVIQWKVTPTNKNITNLQQLTWIVAENLKANHKTMILPIAKALDDGSPVLTKPNIPEPEEIATDR